MQEKVWKLIIYFFASSYFDSADDQLGVEHEDGLVLPRVLSLQVYGVKRVLHDRVDHHGQQDRVLLAKDELH